MRGSVDVLLENAVHLVTWSPWSPARLPASVQEIADVIGRERALFLIGRLPRFTRHDVRGGEQVILYVPRNLKPDHYLVRIMGWHDAQALVDAFGGELLKPGNCACVYRGFRDHHIRRLVAEGVPAAMVAEWFGLTERHVKNLAAENPQEGPGRGANDNQRISDRRKRNAA